MQRKYFFVLGIIWISFNSCKKEYITDVDPNYEGEWHSDTIITDIETEVEKYFIIDGHQGVFGEWCELVPLGNNCSSYFSGEAKFSRNKKKVTIGPLKNQVNIEITEPPHINSDGLWECTLNETVYIKK